MDMIVLRKFSGRGGRLLLMGESEWRSEGPEGTGGRFEGPEGTGATTRDSGKTGAKCEGFGGTENLGKAGVRSGRVGANQQESHAE